MVNLTKVKRNYSITKEVETLRINTENYFNGGKEEFLKNYSYISPSVLVTDNFYSGTSGWHHDGGKHRSVFVPRNMDSIKLTGENKQTNIWKNSQHQNNELTWLDFKESWDGNTLIISWVIKAQVKWTWGSVVGHAVVIRITGGEFIFLSEEQKNNYGIGSINQISNMKTENGNANISFNSLLDSAVIEGRKYKYSTAISTSGFFRQLLLLVMKYIYTIYIFQQILLYFY